MHLTDFADIHTHSPQPQAVYNVDPVELRRQGIAGAEQAHEHLRQLPLTAFSVGIHPWNAAATTAADWQVLEALAREPQCVAIGEAGIDLKHGPVVDAAAQLGAFRRQIELAQALALPMVLHMVGGWQHLFDLSKAYAPHPLWVVHGYRKNAQLAAQLAAAGIGVSQPMAATRPEIDAALPTHLRFRDSD